MVWVHFGESRCQVQEADSILFSYAIITTCMGVALAAPIGLDQGQNVQIQSRRLFVLSGKLDAASKEK